LTLRLYTLKKSGAAAGSTRLRHVHFSNRGTGAASVLRVLTLKGEIETAAEHSEIILRSIDDAEAQVIGPTDVPGEPELETGSELT
jgi:hypothetical protein